LSTVAADLTLDASRSHKEVTKAPENGMGGQWGSLEAYDSPFAGRYHVWANDLVGHITAAVSR